MQVEWNLKCTWLGCWSGFCQVTEGATSSLPKFNVSRTFCGLGKQTPFPVHSKTNITIMTFGSNYHPDLTGTSQATGAVVFADQLTAAESVLEHAVTQGNLTHAIAEQAQVFAEEAVQNWVQVHEVLADVQRARAAVIGPVKIAKAYAAVETMEITASEMVLVAVNQGNIAFWAQARAEDARDDFYTATNTLNSLCQREAESDLDSTFNNENDIDDEGGGVCRGPGSARGKDASEVES
jgi:hypothetical protein